MKDAPDLFDFLGPKILVQIYQKLNPIFEENNTNISSVGEIKHRGDIVIFNCSVLMYEKKIVVNEEVISCIDLNDYMLDEGNIEHLFSFANVDTIKDIAEKAALRTIKNIKTKTIGRHWDFFACQVTRVKIIDKHLLCFCIFACEENEKFYKQETLPPEPTEPILTIKVEFEKFLKEICINDFYDYYFIELATGEYPTPCENKNLYQKVVKIFTECNCYIITVKEKQNGGSYLGCIASTRKPLAGEIHTRSKDLPDGPFCRETWNQIKNAIIGFELVKIAK